MGNMTTQDLAKTLNTNALGAQFSAVCKLTTAVESGDAKKTRSYLSAFGKSTNGFDPIDSNVLNKAFKLMRENGYYPRGVYRTMSFTVVKIVKS